MKKILFICPYFGKLPVDQMKLWLKTCSYNANIDWIVISDDKTKFVAPSNVKFIYKEIDDLRKIIQSKFDFEISLDNGYKLCDYKPIYGYIFEDLIKNYDYWGHCDFSDCIFGDIQKFLFEKIKDNPDKIGFLGHMTLYKNTDEVNKRFSIKTKSGIDLKDIIGTKKNMAFDETFEYSINFIYKENNFYLKRIDDIYFDISPKFHEFKSSSWNENFENLGFNSKKYILEWKLGKLYKVSLDNKKIKKEEIGYVHYQKRNIKFNINIVDTNHFLLIPNEFVEINGDLTEKIVKKNTKSKLVNTNYLKIKFKRLKLKIKENIIRK